MFRIVDPLVCLLLVSACLENEEGSPGKVTDTAEMTSTPGSTQGDETAAGSSTATGQVDDLCPSRAIGGWNACQVGPKTDNSLCNWTASDKTGTVVCLNPAGQSLNVCGIEGCAEDCDCFAPPLTGTAVVTCAPILGEGGKACALYCAGGQICPAGMQCYSGYCYWPAT